MPQTRIRPLKRLPGCSGLLHNERKLEETNSAHPEIHHNQRISFKRSLSSLGVRRCRNKEKSKSLLWKHLSSTKTLSEKQEKNNSWKRSHIHFYPRNHPGWQASRTALSVNSEEGHLALRLI